MKKVKPEVIKHLNVYANCLQKMKFLTIKTWNIVYRLYFIQTILTKVVTMHIKERKITACGLEATQDKIKQNKKANYNGCHCKSNTNK